MKKNYPLLLLLFYGFCGSVFAQKQNAVWVGGDRGEISFAGDNAIALKRGDKKEIDRTSASICDGNGNLLFYTNGFRIFNRLGHIMLNGDSLSLGDYIGYGYGFNDSPDGAVIIPQPSHPYRYYIFYADLNFVDTKYGYDLVPTHLMYAIVDMTLDSGLGGVLLNQKNKVILNDTLTQCVMQAVKHGNGRDWWLVCHKYGSNRYHKFLVTSDTIQGPFDQDVGIIYGFVNAEISSPMKFSLDGSLFVHQSRDSNIVELMNFDRCSGEFYNYSSFKIDSQWVPARGVSFSPNNQFIYVSSNFNEILQFDLTKPDIFNTRTVVGVSDGTEDPFPPNFYLHQLAPDGKIYIVAYDFDMALHVINDPDSPGVACHFAEWGFPLLKNSNWGGGAPNIPNYNLGPLDSSGCDTVITTTLPANQTVSTHSIYPNPSNGKLQLNITGVTSKTEIAIYNTMGEVIEQTTLQPPNGFIHAFFNLQNEPAGVYLLKAHTDRRDFTEKILKE